MILCPPSKGSQMRFFFSYHHVVFHRPFSFHPMVLFGSAVSYAQKKNILCSHFSKQSKKSPFLSQHKLPVDVSGTLLSPL